MWRRIHGLENMAQVRQGYQVRPMDSICPIPAPGAWLEPAQTWTGRACHGDPWRVYLLRFHEIARFCVLMLACAHTPLHTYLCLQCLPLWDQRVQTAPSGGCPLYPTRRHGRNVPTDSSCGYRNNPVPNTAAGGWAWIDPARGVWKPARRLAWAPALWPRENTAFAVILPGLSRQL